MEEVGITKEEQILSGISRMMYTYLRGTGFGRGWHDHPEKHFTDTGIYADKSPAFFSFLKEHDIDLVSHCILSCTIARTEHFLTPMNLYGRVQILGLMKDLRDYCGSSEAFVELAQLIMHLIEYQVGKNLTVFFTFNNLLKDSEDVIGSNKKGKKYLQTYYTLADRIGEMKSAGIDPKLWIIAKYEKCIKSLKDNIAFSAVANFNSLEPDLSTLKKETDDEWRTIRQFLGVSVSCEFPDGSIPKGWRTGGGDHAKIEDIVKITKDGYYYYPDGSQRMGKRHYAGNSYMVIGCNPDNFEEFKKDWDNITFWNKSPTWDEYDQHGPAEKYWDKDGFSLNGRGKSVTWRKK